MNTPATKATPITIARGDGIGPEIMAATLAILEAAGARLAIEEIEIGEAVYRRGHTSGIEPSAWESLRRTKVFLKAPITTPQGGGFNSLNVTIRKTLGLFANVRPCVSYSPFVATRHPSMDVVIVRENEEDLYAGIEYRHSAEVYESLKLISRPGSERIVRYAFELARAQGRRRITCMTKDNIMKMTDGVFHRVFDEVGKEYPEIEQEHMIIDIGMARMADVPERFDVVVVPNLYGDIISDVAAEISGSVGLAGSANIGEHVAMFEAIHGSAPDIAGRDIANPSGLLLGAVQMLVHIGQIDVAERIHNAWLATIEAGIHTGDVYHEGRSERRVGTADFGRAVIERLGKGPRQLRPAAYRTAPALSALSPRTSPQVTVVGVDVFVQSTATTAELVRRLEELGTEIPLRLVTNRGVKVWPEGMPETFCSDHWRCRFRHEDMRSVSFPQILGVLSAIDAAGLSVIKTERLATFDGARGFSLGQGEGE
jgi:isocitrate dehydrogenase